MNIGVEMSIISFPVHAKNVANVWALRGEAFDNSFGPYTMEGICFAEYFEFTLLILQLIISVGNGTVEFEAKFAFDDKTDKLSNIVFDRVDLPTYTPLDSGPNTARRSLALEETEMQLLEEMMKDISFVKKEVPKHNWSCGACSVTNKPDDYLCTSCGAPRPPVCYMPTDLELEDLSGFQEWYITKQTVNGDVKQYSTRKSSEFNYAVKTLTSSLQEQGLDLNEQPAAIAKYPEYISVPDGVKAQYIPDENGNVGEVYNCKDFVTVHLRLPSLSDAVKTIGITTMFPVFHPVRITNCYEKYSLSCIYINRWRN